MLAVVLLCVCANVAWAQTPEQGQNTAAGAPQPRFSSPSGSFGASGQTMGKKEKQHQPNVDIWLPPTFRTSEEKWPLIVFSHDFGGCGNQSKFLTSYLADHGYIVIAPDHEDSDCRKSAAAYKGGLQDLRAGKKGRPERPLRNPDHWTPETESDRKDDVLFAVSSMLDDRMYKNYVDMDRVGLIGYGLGGYTALGLAGGWKEWQDKRFKAVLALSPYAEPYIVNRGLGRVSVPVMYMGGTRDVPAAPTFGNAKGAAYKHSYTKKYFIELDGADHFAWSEREKDYQPVINTLALEFFDKYLKGTEGIIERREGKDRIKTFWKDEGAGRK